MGNPLELVKRHPIMTGVAVLALIIIVVISGSGGGGSQTVADTSAADQSQVAAGLQMQQISAQAAARSAEIGAQKEIALASLASNERIKTLEAESSFNANQLAVNLGLAQLASGERLQTLASTLDASNRVQEMQSSENKERMMFDYLTMQTQTNASIAMAGYNAQIEASRPKGLFSMIFG